MSCHFSTRTWSFIKSRELQTKNYYYNSIKHFSGNYHRTKNRHVKQINKRKITRKYQHEKEGFNNDWKVFYTLRSLSVMIKTKKKRWNAENCIFSAQFFNFSTHFKVHLSFLAFYFTLSPSLSHALHIAVLFLFSLLRHIF